MAGSLEVLRWVEEEEEKKRVQLLLLLQLSLLLFPFAISLHYKSTVIFCFNPECLEISFEVPHSHLTQPLDSIDIREKQAVWEGSGGSAAGAAVSAS